jgi:polyisoprenoid-binding protein YceI
VEHYPKITFDSTSVRKLDEDTYELTGNLTIKNITNEVTFNVEFGGINTDPWGNEKAGFSASAKINRKNWDLTWNAALESGGFLVGDEIKIEAEYQMVRQKKE